MARIKKVGAPIGNKNAETWTLEEATKFLNEAVEHSETNEFDFIGEVAKHMKTTKDMFLYLAQKFPQIAHLRATVINNCEANCFTNAKSGKIVPSLAIMSLKSNHGWTDRAETTTQNVNYDGGKVDKDKVKEILKNIEDEF